MTHYLPIVAVGVLLFIGAAADLLHRKVPNLVSGAVLATGVVTQLISTGFWGMGASVLAGLGVGAFLILGWSARLIGGGDVKLAATAAVCVGWSQLPVYLFATAIAGGIVSIACYLASSRQAQASMRSNLAAGAYGLAPAVATPSGGRFPVPYGVAIAAGALFALVKGSLT